METQDQPQAPAGAKPRKRQFGAHLKYEVAQVLVHTPSIQDRAVWVGQGATRQGVRLIEIQARGTVYR